MSLPWQLQVVLVIRKLMTRASGTELRRTMVSGHHLDEILPVSVSTQKYQSLRLPNSS